MSLSIPLIELRELPAGATWHGKRGQAGAEVAVKGDTLVVRATCDSLQRLVYRYERELRQTRKDSTARATVSETETRKRTGLLKTIITAFIAGVAAGAILIIKMKKT